MQLNRLVVTNYGPYKGENEFVLSPKADAPIILFGGKNGAGKTTLFNAVPLCLHGRSAFVDRISRSKYHNRIRSKLHESNGEKATKASIQIQFEYGNFGEVEEYTVEREWRDRGKSLEESLTVLRNGSRLSDLQEENWDDFLKELIPPGISQLFFFDGEKVKELASAIEAGNAFEESLFSLLGLNLVDRLDADLSIYLSSKLDESGHEELAEKVESLRHEKANLEVDYEQLEGKLDEKRHRVDEISEQIEKKETELAQEGGAFARARDSLKNKQKELDEQIEEIEEEIREIARGTYPFTLTPNLCREVVEQLKSEQQAETEAAAQALVVSELDELTDEDSVWGGLDVSAEKRDEIIDRLQADLANRFKSTAPSGRYLSQDFSEREQEQIFRIVDEALLDVPEELQRLTVRLEGLNRERQEVVQNIKRAPEQSVISPILDEINELNQEHGKIQKEIEDLVETLEELETKIEHLENERDKTIAKQEDLEDVSDRAELAQRTREAVQDYRDEIVRAKLERLESVLSDRYTHLTNKPDFYDAVVLDPESLSIEVETVDGERKDQSELSAGERQIFATAMLWALAEISDRPLPFIVDTPLGRLDKDHRRNLVERFFPKAAHQVLLFSTDTEITRDYFESLESDIAQMYHLDHRDHEGRTDVRPGYFWTEETNKSGEEDVTVHERQANLTFNND